MARPRKQTYTMDLFLKNIKEQDIRQDQDVQRLSDQWSNAMMNELIVTVLNDGYIPSLILAQEFNSQMWLVDGLQRSSTFMRYRYGNYKITKSVEEPVITYRAKVRNTENEVMIDGNGDIVWEIRQFDIRNKSYSQLPEELKKIFDEYQIETVVHEGYNMTEISKFVRRYNFHKSMNASQKMFTYVDRHARKIREILRKSFFVECTGYTKGERENGTMERVVMESVMCMFHLSDWKKSGKLGEYINENAKEWEFDTLEEIIGRLENIISEQHYSVFNSRDSFIWFTLFHKFTQLGYDDEKFADFVVCFKDMTDGIDMNEFYSIDKNDSTKDKSVILKKLNKLEKLMHEYLGISTMETEIEVGSVSETGSEADTSSILGFVRENVASYVTGEDIDLYKEVLETLTQKINASSILLEDENMPSLVALIGYSFKCDIDLDDWFVDYCSRNDTYIINQQENYDHMVDDLEKFIRYGHAA